MKQRTIKTSIYLEDDWFNTLSIRYKYLFIYLFTNSHIGFTGIYELSDRVMQMETGLTKEEIAKGKEQFTGRVKFFKGWVYVVNSNKHNEYLGPLNKVALQKEKDLIPKEIKDHFSNRVSISYGYPDNNNNNNKNNDKDKNVPLAHKEARKKLEEKGIIKKKDFGKVFDNFYDKETAEKAKQCTSYDEVKGVASFVIIFFTFLISSIFSPTQALTIGKTSSVKLNRPGYKLSVKSSSLSSTSKPVENIKEQKNIIVHVPPTRAVIENKPLSVKEQTIKAFEKEFGAEHTQALDNLIGKGESGFNPYAGNPKSGACGIFQAYPCQKLLNVCGTLDNIDCQIEWGKNYIARRYGNPSNAYKFWLERHPVNGVDVGHWY